MRYILGSIVLILMSVMPVQADETVRISWTPPTTGGQVATYELVATYDGSPDQIIYSGVNPEWTGSLTDGEWVFRVRAVNNAGPGPWSAWSDVSAILSPPGGCGIPLLERI